MGSATSSDNDAGPVSTEPRREGAAAGEPAADADGGVDAVRRRRDNSAREADDWLAGGLEEAGYGYGV